MHYSSEVSGCPASCMQQEAPSTCTLPANEGCACDEGMVLNGKTCTYISDCGCFDENGDYTPVSNDFRVEIEWKCVRSEKQDISIQENRVGCPCSVIAKILDCKFEF